MKRTATIASVQTSIANNWPEIVKRAQANGVRPNAAKIALRNLPQSPRLLGTSTKTTLGNGLGVLTRVIYMAPAASVTMSWASMCGDATPHCIATCLVGSGRMPQKGPKLARIWKTVLFKGSPALFRALLMAEARSFAKTAQRAGKVGAIRVDGTSDTGLGQAMAPEIARLGLRVYDYTKSLARIPKAQKLEGLYSLTLSYKGGHAGQAEALKALKTGGGLAVVFDTPKGAKLPESFMGFPVIDGDLSDARFLDRELGLAPQEGGYVVGLRFKTSGNRQKQIDRAGPFVVRT